MGAEDCVKEDVRWRYGFQLVKNLNKDGNTNPKKKRNRKPRVRKAGVNLVNVEMMKAERKSLKQECKKMLKEAWSSGSDDSTDKDEDDASVPSNFKHFTVQDRQVVLQRPNRQKPKMPRVSYDGLEDAKKIDLAEPGEEPKPTWIATDLSQEEEELLISMLKKYKDVFAWSYQDLKGVDPAICQHTIPMQEDAEAF